MLWMLLSRVATDCQIRFCGIDQIISHLGNGENTAIQWLYRGKQSEIRLYQIISLTFKLAQNMNWKIKIHARQKISELRYEWHTMCVFFPIHLCVRHLQSPRENSFDKYVEIENGIYFLASPATSLRFCQRHLNPCYLKFSILFFFF